MSKVSWIILVVGVLAVLTVFLVMRKKCNCKDKDEAVTITDANGNEIPVTLVNNSTGRYAVDGTGNIIASDSGTVNDSAVGGVLAVGDPCTRNGVTGMIQISQNNGGYFCCVSCPLT